MSLVNLNKKGEEIQDSAFFSPPKKEDVFTFMVRARPGVRQERHLQHEILRGWTSGASPPHSVTLRGASFQVSCLQCLA